MANRLTGTGLDRLVEIIETNEGLRRSISTSEIAEGARAAGDLNALIVDGIKSLGLANDGKIDASDVRALGDWAQADAKRHETFLDLYGTGRNGSESGFQLVEREDANARIFGESAVDEVADAIYSFGFGYSDGRLIDVNGDLYRSVALTARWLDDLLTDADMAALNNPEADVVGTTGTGLDRLVGLVTGDPGLVRHISQSDIAEGARAADALNHMYIDGIMTLGLANDGSINSSDVIALGDWISTDAERYADFLELHGADEGGASTGWHRVLQKGAATAYIGVEDGIHPHGGHVINHAMKGIYQIGYGSVQGRLLNDEGDPKITTRIPAAWLDQLLTDADMKDLSAPDVAAHAEGTTGTGLDRLVEIIDSDPGLARKLSRFEIAAGAEAADGLNHMIVDGIRTMGLANDGAIDASDVRALGDWARADATRYQAFVDLYGTSKDGVETGFQLVERNDGHARIFGEGAVDEVADAIYSFGFGDRSGRLLDVDGKLYRSIALTADWLDEFLTDADMKALSAPGVEMHVKGTTGTGLDKLVEIINTDPGLAHNASRTSIVEGARAADALNTMIADTIEALGLAGDGRIDDRDTVKISDRIRSDADLHEEFLLLHGNDENGVETGFHQVEGTGASSQLFGMNAINNVAEGVYHVGFEIESNRFLDEGGEPSVSVARVAEWIDDLYFA